MTVFSLKILALICMTLDHIAVFFAGMPVQLRWIGRIAAPVFIFCLCEGVDHTSSEKKYLLRLYLCSLLMALIQVKTGISANIFRTLFVTAFFCVIIKNIRKGKEEYKGYLILFCLYQLITTLFLGYFYINDQSILLRRLYSAIFGSVAFCEGGLPFILMGILIYHLKDSKKKLVIWFSLFTVLYAILSLTNITTAITEPLIALTANPDHYRYIVKIVFFMIAGAFRPGITGKDPFTESYQWMMIVSLIPMCFYNGQKGKSMKWFFYVYYAAHLLLMSYLKTAV